TRSTRWPHPLPVLAFGTRAGMTLTSPAATAASGVELVRWRTTDSGRDDTSYTLDLAGGSVEVAYSGCTVLAVAYVLRASDGDVEAHEERWWLLPGVGLVRRDADVRLGNGPPVRSSETFAPTFVNLGL